LKRTFRVFFFIFFLPYLCLQNLGLVGVVWVCFDVLFFISEFHFLFLLIFILFSLACLYMCVVGVFLYGVCFNVCYVTVLYQFYFERICFSKMRLKVENYISRIFFNYYIFIVSTMHTFFFAVIVQKWHSKKKLT